MNGAGTDGIRQMVFDEKGEAMMQNDAHIKHIKNGLLEQAFGSWKEFGDFVADIERCYPTLIYRGQANSAWRVESTLDRMERDFSTTPNNSSLTPVTFDHPPVSRKLQLDRFKEMARGKLASPPTDDAEDEWWALAQHHGLATPMLDWTYSPFVALFFAFENEKCDCNGEYKEPHERVVFALAHHLISKKDDAPRPFSPRGHANYRLINQGGLFLRMPEPKDESNGETVKREHIDLESYLRKNFSDDTYGAPKSEGKGNLHPRAILVKFIIPSDAKDRVECLRYLDHMNINRASLFPDLDGAARYINDLWEVNFDKAIGHINAD